MLVSRRFIPNILVVQGGNGVVVSTLEYGALGELSMILIINPAQVMSERCLSAAAHLMEI